MLCIICQHAGNLDEVHLPEFPAGPTPVYELGQDFRIALPPLNPKPKTS